LHLKLIDAPFELLKTLFQPFDALDSAG